MQPIIDKFLSRSDNDLPKLSKLLSDGQLSGTAEVVAEYELALAQTFGVRRAVAVSSGSTAIQAALSAIDAKAGDEVLVPATAPLPSVFPITANGLIPIAVDVTEGSVGFDPEDLERKISSRTCAALAVPLWGYPQDLRRIRSILDATGIPLIEDAAHAHGARSNGKMVGTEGLLGCFSTHDRKLLATGEGGFILTDNEEIADRIQSYTRLGNLRGDETGVNYKINAMAAAVGIARIPLLEVLIRMRTENAQYILREIGSAGSISELDYPEGGKPNYYNLTFVLTSEGHATRQLEKISAQGIAIDQIKYGYNVFYRRNAYKDIAASCPNAESLMERLVQIPVHPGLDQADLARIVEIIRGAI
ncbi:hypothetical protein G6M50_26490 [Agrobacterium rhizogenes]|nr:hypothetical protein [Rhizobium rhizogenes]NTJ81338.1 hypothetical protein [Rhizobium rhizogenes]